MTNIKKPVASECLSLSTQILIFSLRFSIVRQHFQLQSVSWPRLNTKKDQTEHLSCCLFSLPEMKAENLENLALLLPEYTSCKSDHTRKFLFFFFSTYWSSSALKLVKLPIYIVCHIYSKMVLIFLVILLLLCGQHAPLKHRSLNFTVILKDGVLLIISMICVFILFKFSI